MDAVGPYSLLLSALSSLGLKVDLSVFLFRRENLGVQLELDALLR